MTGISRASTAGMTREQLAAVTGGQGACQLEHGLWRPAPPNTTLDGNRGFARQKHCVAAVDRWKTSLMNIDNDRAD